MNSASTIWVDAAGGQTIYRVRSNSGVGSLNSGIQAVSDADWSTCWESAESLNTPAPTAAQYLPVKPDAIMSFLCLDGTIAYLRIPAPRVGIMLADSVTIDPLNASVLSLIAAALGNLASSSGSLAASYLGGRLDSTQR